MTVYITVFFILIVLMIMGYVLNSNIPVILMGSIMILFAGLRLNVGLDYTAYENVYGQIKSGIAINTVIPQFEKGFLGLNWLAVKLGLSFNVFLLLFSFLTIGLLVLFLVRLRNPRLAVMALMYYFSRFYFTRDFGQIRSSFAAVVCLYALLFLVKGKIFKFFLSIIIAYLFQRVAVIVLLAAFLVKILKRWASTASFVLALIGAISLAKITTLFLQNHLMIFGSYSAYLTADAYVSGNQLLNPIIWIQVFICLVALRLFFKNNVNQNDTLVDKYGFDIFSQENIQRIIVFYAMGTLLLVLLNQYPTMAGRLTTIINTVEMFVVPLIIRRIFRSYFSLILFIPFSIGVWYMFFVHTGISLYVPYRFF